MNITSTIRKTCATFGAGILAFTGVSAANAQEEAAVNPDFTIDAPSPEEISEQFDNLTGSAAQSVSEELANQSLFDEVGGVFTCPSNIVLSIPATANSASFIPEEIPFGLGNLGNFGRLAAHPGTQVKTVPYNASWWTSAWTYTESRDMGIAAAHRILSEQAAKCPNAKFHFYGYSEGSDVASALIEGISHGQGPISPEQFGSASLIANPTRNVSAPQGRQIGATSSGTGGFFPSRDYGSTTDRVLEVCNVGDVVCDTNPTAGSLYHQHVRDAMSNTALFKGRFVDNALYRLVESMKPETAIPALMEVPASVVGWVIHIGSYLAGGFDQGTRHIEAHLA